MFTHSLLLGVLPVCVYVLRLQCLNLCVCVCVCVCLCMQREEVRKLEIMHEFCGAVGLTSD